MKILNSLEVCEAGRSVIVKIGEYMEECLVIRPIYMKSGVKNYLVESFEHDFRFIAPSETVAYNLSESYKTTGDANNLFSIGDIVCRKGEESLVGIIKAAASNSNLTVGYVVEFTNIRRPAEIWKFDDIIPVSQDRVLAMASEVIDPNISNFNIINLDDK